MGEPGIRSSNWCELNAAKSSVGSLALLLTEVWRPVLGPHAGWFAAPIQQFHPQDR